MGKFFRFLAFSLTFIGVIMTFLNNFIAYLPTLSFAQATPEEVQFYGLLIFMIGVVICFFVSLLDFLAKEPAIKIGDPYFCLDSFLFCKEDPFGGEVDCSASLNNIDAIKIDITNTPKNPSEENWARNVKARITYYDSNKKQLGPARQGKWVSGNLPKSIGRISEVAAIDIDSSNGTQTLDLAIQIFSGVPLLFNNETLFLKLGSEKENNFHLDQEKTYACIKLLGYRVKKEVCVEFSFKEHLCKKIRNRKLKKN